MLRKCPESERATTSCCPSRARDGYCSRPSDPCDRNPETSEADVRLNNLLSGKVKSLFEEFDEKHHLVETQYLQTNSEFDQGMTVALAEVCSKLMVILNETT